MPRRCEPDPRLDGIIQFQDHLVHRDQALDYGLTAETIRYRLRTGQWQILLPKVYLTHTGEPSRRQLLIGALLFAGSDAAIDGPDACRFHGVRSVGLDPEQVHVLVPFGSPVRSRGYVIVRRTTVPMAMVKTERLRFVDAATAVISATRLMQRDRAVLAALSEAMQQRKTTYDDLVRAHVQGPRANSRRTDDALEQLGAGIRSVAEADFRNLVLASPHLPDVRYNIWLRLETGLVVCADALIKSSAVIHETNGRRWHEREDLFEDMQVRHTALTTSGFAVLHNPANRVRKRGREVIAQFERCHQLYAGRGIPARVEVLSGPP